MVTWRQKPGWQRTTRTKRGGRMAPYDIVWSIGLVPVLVLMGAALVSLFRREPRMTLIVSLVWFFAIVFLPVVGPLLWFLSRAVQPKKPEMEKT